MFHESLHTKTSFKDYENSKLKESNNWDFSRGYSPWFWSKIDILSCLHFSQNSKKICVLRYCRKKKRLRRQ